MLDGAALTDSPLLSGCKEEAAFSRLHAERCFRPVSYSHYDPKEQPLFRTLPLMAEGRLWWQNHAQALKPPLRGGICHFHSCFLTQRHQLARTAIGGGIFNPPAGAAREGS